MNNGFCFWKIGEDWNNIPNQIRHAMKHKPSWQYVFSDEHGAKPSFD
jgi:hypothetical protein